MADELLVSTVRYKGVNVGTASITVEDTSSLSNYDFRLTNADTGAVTDPTGLRQLNEYILRVTDQTPRGESKYIYLRWTAPDGKFLSDGSSNTGVAKTVTESLSIPTDGVANIRFKNNFFPSATGYTGKLELHHDANRTLLIRTFNFSVQMASSPYIRIIPERNANNGTSYPPTVKMGERFIVRIDAIGDDVLTKTQNAKYAATVAGQPLNGSGYISPVDDLAIGVYKSDALSHYGGWQTLQANLQNLDVPGQTITVQMGEVSTQNYLVNVGAVNAGPFSSVTTPVNVDVLHRGGVMSNYAMFYGQGISRSSAYSGMLGSVSFISDSYPNVTTAVHVPAVGDTSLATMRTPWIGDLAILAFRPDNLTTAVSRQQFGKFQKVITGQYAGALAWSALSDSISDSLYGTVSDLKNSDLVVLPQPVKRAEVTFLKFNNNKIELNVSWNTQNAEGNVYDGNISTLVLRASETLENYDPAVPYPRVIKAGRVNVNNGSSVIEIPASSTINLNESRYVVQHAVEMTSTAASGAFASVRVVSDTKKITLVLPTAITGTLIHHYAIWDLGPGLVQFPEK